MSKKQREKVEDEVRFHRAQMRAQGDTAPDSSVFDTQTPSSSDQLHHGYNKYVNQLESPSQSIHQKKKSWISSRERGLRNDAFESFILSIPSFPCPPIVTTHIQMKLVMEVLTAATQRPSRRNKTWPMTSQPITSTVQRPTSHGAPSSTQTSSVDIVSLKPLPILSFALYLNMALNVSITQHTIIAKKRLKIIRLKASSECECLTRKRDFAG